MTDTIRINRAPVLTLWAAVVMERLGYDRDEALTLARAVARLNAKSKGRRLGIIEEDEAGADGPEPAADDQVKVLGRPVSVVNTPEGLRALSEGKTVSPGSVERYLRSKFHDRLDDARATMQELAASLDGKQLERRAYALYEAFRPDIPEGTRGWGANGDLDLDRVRELMREKS